MTEIIPNFKDWTTTQLTKMFKNKLLTSVRPNDGLSTKASNSDARVRVSNKFVDFLIISSTSVELKKHNQAVNHQLNWQLKIYNWLPLNTLQN